MHARQLAIAQMGLVRTVLDAALDDIPQEMVNTKPGGTVSSIGQTLCHAAMSQDMFLNTFAQGTPTIYSSGGWATKMGGPAEGAADWDDGINLNLAVFKDYLGAVYAATEAYLLSATDEALGKELETPLGKLPALVMVGGLGIIHLAEHLGDVATIKGVNGLKGLPF